MATHYIKRYVHVVAFGYNYEGYAEPEKAFETLANAVDYAEANKNKGDYYTIETLEVE